MNSVHNNKTSFFFFLSFVFFKMPFCKRLVIIFFALSGFTQCKEINKLPPGDPDNGGLFLPDNFEAVVVADSIGHARHIAVSDNGDIYAKLRFAKNGKGGNVALRDTTNDGKADIIQQFGNYEDEGSLANGMRIHNGYLYFSSARVVYRNKLSPDNLIPGSEMEVILTDDHEHDIHWHITKPVSFDKQGNMYVPFGAPSNACHNQIPPLLL